MEPKSVTRKSENVTTKERDASRARALLQRDVTVSRVTDPMRDVTAGRDSDIPAPEGPDVTITPVGMVDSGRKEEQTELTRLCAQRIVDNYASGRVVVLRDLAWARQFIEEHPPLGRPLGTGEPRKNPFRGDPRFAGWDAAFPAKEGQE